MKFGKNFYSYSCTYQNLGAVFRLPSHETGPVLATAYYHWISCTNSISEHTKSLAVLPVEYTAGLSSGELRQLGSLACFLESFVFWVALVKREIPRIMKTILIRMMKVVRMTRLRDEGASPEVLGHLTRLRKNSSHERCMTVSRLRR